MPKETYSSGASPMSEEQTTSFDAIMQKHFREVFALAYRMMRDQDLAQDITQHVFLRAYKNRSKFDTSQNARSWLFAVARNCAIDMLRRRKREAFATDRFEAAPVVNSQVLTFPSDAKPSESDLREHILLEPRSNLLPHEKVKRLLYSDPFVVADMKEEELDAALGFLGVADKAAATRSMQLLIQRSLDHPHDQENAGKEAYSKSAIELLNALPKRSRTLIELVYFEGMTHQEAAEYLGLSVVTVRAMIYRAIRQIKSSVSKSKSKLA